MRISCVGTKLHLLVSLTFSRVSKRHSIHVETRSCQLKPDAFECSRQQEQNCRLLTVASRCGGFCSSVTEKVVKSQRFRLIRATSESDFVCRMSIECCSLCRTIPVDNSDDTTQVAVQANVVRKTQTRTCFIFNALVPIAWQYWAFSLNLVFLSFKRNFLQNR